MISPQKVSCLLVALFLFHGAIPLAAKTYTFDQEKCHLDIPDGWTEQKTEGNKISVINSDQTKSFTLRTVDTGPNLTVDDAAFIKGLEGSITANGFTITDRPHASLAGIDAYAIDASRTMPAGPVSTRTLVTMANSYAYGLSVSKVNGKPMDDPELAGIVNSFGFIGAPELPQSGPDQLSYRIGQLFGGILLPVLVIIVAFKWLRRKR